jgi:hypothetical protein
MLLSSKTIRIGDHGSFESAGRAFYTWLSEIGLTAGEFDDKKIVVRLEDDQPRQKKTNAKQELESMAADAALEDKDVWVRHGYKFAFLSQGYFWNGEEIYLTAGERLFLFHWLVLSDTDYTRFHMDYLYNMRRRLGENFLTEESI